MSSTIEERVAYLEGKVEEHSKVWMDLREHMVRLEQRIIDFEQRIDRRFESFDKRFVSIDRRFEAIDRRIDALDHKFSRYFLWIIGIQVSVLLAIIATMLR